VSGDAVRTAAAALTEVGVPEERIEAESRG
jgi:hypothetical protein